MGARERVREEAGEGTGPRPYSTLFTTEIWSLS